MRIALKMALQGIFLALLFSSWSQAEEYEYKDYTVKKGDTLWRISKRQLKEPFDWPMVWKENMRINNPDRIYPGQVIRIPVGLKKQTVREAMPPIPPVEAPVAAPQTMPAAKPKAVTEKKPVVETIEAKKVSALQVEIVLSGGYVSADVPRKGEISGSLGGKSMFGKGDEAYLKGVGPAVKGQKFYVVRKGPKVFHPASGAFLGYLIKINGTVEVTKAEGGIVEATVVEFFNDIVVGDTLDDYYEVEPVLLLEPSRPLPGLKGVVVAANNMRKLSGLLDVVYIDKGKSDGLEPGDMLIAVVPGTSDKTNAVLRVVNSRNNTSTAVIMESRGPIGKGDAVIGTK